MRLQPAVVQNVVTYSTVIAVPNPQLKLKPGMTANVNIEIARKTNVLRVPTRRRGSGRPRRCSPVLNQEMPPELQRGGAAGGRRPWRRTRGQEWPGAAQGVGPARSRAVSRLPQPPAAAAASRQHRGAQAPSVAAARQGRRSRRRAGRQQAVENPARGARTAATAGGGRGGFDPEHDA